MSPRGRIFVLSAPSGTGKSTVGSQVLKRLPWLSYSVSLTTRSPRPGEVDGRDYHFVTRDQFLEAIEAGEMAEYAEIYGNLYGTSAKKLEEAIAQGQDVFLDIDVKGAGQLRSRFPDGVFIFLMPPSLDELEKRLRSRGTESPEELERRLARAASELEEAAKYDYQVVNQVVEKAVGEVIGIVEAGVSPGAGKR